MQQGYWDNAIAEYTTARELDPSVVVGTRLSHAYANRGTAYFLSANYDAAISDFQDSYQQDNAAEVGVILSDSFKARAAQYLENGEYDRAISDAKAVLNYNSADAAAYYIIGTALIGKGEWDLAITELSKAVGIDKAIDTDLKLAQAYLERAKLLIAQDKQMEATKFIDQAIVLANESAGKDSTSTTAYRRLANAYILLQQYDVAMSYLDKALEIDSGDSVAYTLMGEILSRTGNSDAALLNLNKAISINPDNATAYYQRAIVYLDQGKKDLVIADLSKAIELNPQFYLFYNRALVYRTMALQQTGSEKSELLALAINDFTKSIEIQPNLFQSYFWRGRSYVDMQQWDLAKTDLQKVMELSDDPEMTAAAQNLLQQITGR
jgi:tetratricopeptide (TPR) repeat protein